MAEAHSGFQARPGWPGDLVGRYGARTATASDAVRQGQDAADRRKVIELAAALVRAPAAFILL